MSEVPWWALSPSPMTLAFWGSLSLYGAYRLNAHTLREWLGRFGDSAFILGLIILPFDAAWQIGQWLRFGYLYPGEWLMVLFVLGRDLSGTLLCYLLSRNLFASKGPLRLWNLKYLVYPLALLTVLFVCAVDPSMTDWTYAIRFGGAMSWWQSYVYGLPTRAMQAYAYVRLWKN